MDNTTTILRFTLALCVIGALVACSEEPPPPSVREFMDDPILLDATMVRCVANRDSVSYEPECVNAREAVERIAAVEEEARRGWLEAESERKQAAVRRAQEAADEARRRAAEAQRLREEARLLGLLPVSPEEALADSEELSFIQIDGGTAAATVTVQDVPPPAAAAVPASGVMEPEPGQPSGTGSQPPPTTDLGEIREQLGQRRSAPPPETSNQGA